MLWPLSRAKLVVFLRVNGNEGLLDPFELGLSGEGIHAALLGEKHDPSHLLSHLLGEVYLFGKGDFRADAGADVRVELLVQSLHRDEALCLEELKDHLDGCAPSEIALVLKVVRWKLDCCRSRLFFYHCF